MASKTHKAATGRNGSTNADASSAPAEAAGFALAREQWQLAVEWSEVFLKGAEEMRRCQMEAARQLRLRLEKAHGDAAAAVGPHEFLQLQAELLRDDIEFAGRYMSELASVCSRLQAEALEHVGPQGKAAATLARPAETDVAGDPWKQWADLGKQWTEMLYRTEAALH